jgi:4-hydroxy-tetrahydrodipicolinate synthase
MTETIMPLLDTSAHGVYIIAATPFTDDGAVDTASLDRLMDFYVRAGITGVTVLGIMGEAPKLTHQEAVALTRQVVRRVNGLPVIVGVSSPGFASMAALTKDVMDAGAGGVMIAPPSTLKTDDQIVAYFGNAVEAIGDDVPFVIQDYPYASGVYMAPSVIKRIVNDHPSAKMVKHEEWPGLEKLTALKAQMSNGMRQVAILCGNGGIFLPHELERGADGANTGYAYPEMLVQLVKLIKSGERAAAHDLFDRHLPLLRYEQQPGMLGLAVRKYILKRRGAIASDAQRKPGIRLSKEAVAEIEFLIARLERNS